MRPFLGRVMPDSRQADLAATVISRISVLSGHPVLPRDAEGKAVR
ncbi:hypothetical protein EDD34_1961 [Myceligenerans xiligouense]|uniref:Uncharacterized protein n=1 Tax=Myceligenerans xiligouense TaxID=253184 RepID=A0A3N4YPN7_9MICO|nr:hypothetical protein EDD34_1961 [Myceligenerans xiligouense]